MLDYLPLMNCSYLPFPHCPHYCHDLILWCLSKWGLTWNDKCKQLTFTTIPLTIHSIIIVVYCQISPRQNSPTTSSCRVQNGKIVLRISFNIKNKTNIIILYYTFLYKQIRNTYKQHHLVLNCLNINVSHDIRSPNQSNIY